MLISEIVISKPKPLEEWDWDEETPVKKWSAQNYATYEGSNSLNDMLVSMQTAKVISKRFAALLKPLRDQVSIFPISLRHATEDKTIPGYHIMIVNHLCDCIDLKEVPHRRVGKEIELTSWRAPLVLKRNKIPEHFHIFRTAKLPSKIILREDLCERIESKNFTGVRVTLVKLS